ncbi:MAG: hypothetical protein QM690_17715 [Sphingobium sp.]
MSDGESRGLAPREKRRRALRNACMSRRWSAAREAVFFTELAETANVTHAAERAGMSSRAAHVRRQRDAGFAARWMAALEAGYFRLEMLMLHHALEGSERTETVRDGDGRVKQVKTVRSHPHGVAMRLLQAHRETVERFRAMEAMRDASDPQLVEKVRAELARVRARLTGMVADAGGDDG